MCDCKSKMEAVLAEKLQGTLPADAQDLSVSLGGYALLLGAGGQLEHKNQVEVRGTYSVPGKAGTKTKSVKLTLTGNFCMFCGQPYGREHAPGEN